MTPEPPAGSLHQRVLATWQQAFPELTDPVDEPGTSILSDPQTPPTGWVSLWPVGQRVVTRVAPDVARQLRAVLDGLPPGHRMTADDVAACWPDRPVEYRSVCTRWIRRPSDPRRRDAANRCAN